MRSYSHLSQDERDQISVCEPPAANAVERAVREISGWNPLLRGEEASKEIPGLGVGVTS
jgi:hypothetical protein